MDALHQTLLGLDVETTASADGHTPKIGAYLFAGGDYDATALTVFPCLKAKGAFTTRKAVFRQARALEASQSGS
jgi:hypothetical protein